MPLRCADVRGSTTSNACYSIKGNSITMTQKTPADPNEASLSKRSLNPLQIIGSVFAAGLGVQSSKNRERDFAQGRAGAFIVAGIVFTALFVGAVYTVVSLVLAAR